MLSVRFVPTADSTIAAESIARAFSAARSTRFSIGAPAYEIIKISMRYRNIA